MKQKLLSGFVFLLIMSSFTTGASAAGSTTGIFPGTETDSTSRITLSKSGDLKISFQNYEGNKVTYRVFKDGKQYKTYTSSKVESVSHTLAGSAAQYSLRLYCNTPESPKSNCRAYGGISIK